LHAFGGAEPNAGSDPRPDDARRPPASPPSAGVGAVIVTYRPDGATLARAIEAIAPQVDRVFVMDNGEGDPSGPGEDRVPPNASIRRMGHNRGIAAAQNAGIEAVRESGAAYVLLLDHDTICAPDMVARLVAAIRRLEAEGIPISAVGPQYGMVPGEPLSGFVRFGRFGFQRRWSAPDGEDVVEADFLISSGSLLPLAALDRIGGMDETLFIDHVDTEWFLRARDRGFRCFGVLSAEMEHALGEGSRRFWLGRWRRVPDHRPFRYYYIVRNSLLLYRRGYAPRRWIAGDFLRLLAIGVLNLTIRGERRARLRMMALGLRDGLAGHAGPAPVVH
jgi:rhamnosyltransferase